MMNEQKEEPAGRQSRKKLWLICAGAGLGILLLLVGSGWFGGKEGSAPATEAATGAEELAEYRKEVEGRIRDLCRYALGSDRVEVAVSLAGGFETVYATEEKNGATVYTVIGSGSNAEALILTRKPPEIAGIGIVCRGGGTAETRAELTALISAAFHVPTNRIRISEAG